MVGHWWFDQCVVEFGGTFIAIHIECFWDGERSFDFVCILVASDME